MRLDRGQIEVVDDAVAEILRSKTPSERLQIASGLWSFGRELVVNVLRSQHPDWDERKIAREAARRLSHGAV